MFRLRELQPHCVETSRNGDGIGKLFPRSAILIEPLIFRRGRGVFDLRGRQDWFAGGEIPIGRPKVAATVGVGRLGPAEDAHDSRRRRHGCGFVVHDPRHPGNQVMFRDGPPVEHETKDIAGGDLQCDVMRGSDQIAQGDRGPALLGPNLPLSVQDCDPERTAPGAMIILAHGVSRDADGSCPRRGPCADAALGLGRLLPASADAPAAGAFPVALDAAGLIGRSAEIGGRVVGRRHPLHRREEAIIRAGLFAPAFAARLAEMAAQRRERHGFVGRRLGDGPAAGVAVSIHGSHGIFVQACQPSA